MEIEAGNAVEPTPRIEVSHRGQRCDLVGRFDYRWAEAVAILNRRVQPLHEGACVFSEALLAWYERVAVVGVFHVAYLEIGRDTDVVVWAKNQAGSFPREKLSNRFDFLRRGFLLRNHVVQTKHH